MIDLHCHILPGVDDGSADELLGLSPRKIREKGVALSFVEALPLYDLGLSWILPAAAFGLIAALPGLFTHSRSRSGHTFHNPTEEH